jgi:colicin import membrane protein
MTWKAIHPSKRGDMRFITYTVLAAALAFTGCDDSAKKAEEAKKVAEATAATAAARAKEAAEKARVEAEKAQAAAKAMLDTGKAELGKRLSEAVDAADARVAPLKAKVAKLPRAAKAKADAALKSYEEAKTRVAALKAQIDTADANALADLTNKGTEALASVTKAFEAVETAISPAKKAPAKKK